MRASGWVDVGWCALALVVLFYGVTGAALHLFTHAGPPHWGFALLVYAVMGVASLAVSFLSAEQEQPEQQALPAPHA